MAADGSVVIEIKGDADELLRAFRKINNSADGLEDELEGAARAVNRIGDNMGKAAGGAGRLGDIIKGSFLGNLASDAVSMVADAFMDLGKEALTAADSLTKFESTMSFAGFSTEEIETSRQAVQDYASRTVYDLETVANTTAQLAANGVADYQALTEAAGNLNAVAGGNADTFGSVAMVLTQTAGAGKLTTENWNQLADAIPGASGKLQEAMLANGAYTGNFRDAMAEGQITAEEFNQAIMQLGMSDAAIEAASSVATIEGAVGNLKATIVDGFANLLTDGGGMEAITGFINGIATTLQNAGQYIGPAIEGIRSALSGIGEAFTSAFSPEQQAAIMGFFQRLGPAIVGVPFQVVSAAVQALSGAFQLLIGVSGAVTDFFSGLPGAIDSAGQGFNNLISTISGALSAALSAVVSWGSNVVSSIGDALSGALSALASWGSSMVSGATSAMSNVVSAIGSTLRGAISQVVTIGGQIIQGLVKGIRAGASKVVSALKGVVQSAINAAKAALGIASPSKVFKKFGEWTSEGYAIGVEDGTIYAERAVNNLADVMTSEIERLNDELSKLNKEAAVERAKTAEEIQKESIEKQIHSLEDLADAYEDAIEDVRNATDKMADNLSDFDLFHQEDDGFTFLWDIQPMIDSINAYGDAILALKDRGISDTLLEEILGMDRGEATAFANELLTMADEQYDGYMALWEEKEAAAQRVAEAIYASEVESINAEYSEKLPGLLADSAEGAMSTFTEGIADGGDKAVAEATRIADEIIAQINRINAEQMFSAAANEALGKFNSSLGSSVTSRNDAVSASKIASAQQAAMATSMATSMNSSREIVLNINGKEAARALVDDIRSVEDQSPRIVSD